jgi:hypothetical protein
VVFGPMLEDEGLFEVLIVVHPALVEDPGVEEYISLRIGLPECLILAFLEIEELVLHIDALLILDDDELVVGVVALVLEAA